VLLKFGSSGWTRTCNPRSPESKRVSRLFSVSTEGHRPSPVNSGTTEPLITAWVFLSTGRAGELHAVRKRLTQLGVPKSRDRIDTIAGWALQYAQEFPKVNRYAKPAHAAQEDWANVYKGVTDLLRSCPANTIVGPRTLECTSMNIKTVHSRNTCPLRHSRTLSHAACPRRSPSGDLQFSRFEPGIYVAFTGESFSEAVAVVLCSRSALDRVGLLVPQTIGTIPRAVNSSNFRHYYVNYNFGSCCGPTTTGRGKALAIFSNFPRKH
jgi:hypothetical protein